MGNYKVPGVLTSPEPSLHYSRFPHPATRKCLNIQQTKSWGPLGIEGESATRVNAERDFRSLRADNPQGPCESS